MWMQVEIKESQEANLDNMVLVIHVHKVICQYFLVMNW